MQQGRRLAGRVVDSPSVKGSETPSNRAKVGLTQSGCKLVLSRKLEKMTFRVPANQHL